MSDEYNSNGAGSQTGMSDKSKAAAALLCFFLGALGIHRFYLGKITSGVVMLICTVVGWLTIGLIVGFGFIFVVAVWELIDFICILCGSMGDAEGRKLR